jgi:hypothetical protein
MSEIKVEKNVPKPTEVKKTGVEMVTIHIHEQEGVGGSDDVFVQDGNKEWLIKRGVDVDVPLGVYNILRAAVITTYEPHKSQNGEIEYKPRNFPRFNMTRV